MDRVVRVETAKPVDLYELVALLWRGRLRILLFAVAFALVGAAAAFLMTPVFRAEATVQVREQAGGTGALRSLAGQLGPLSALAGALTPDEDERSVALATLKSRAIIERYIDREKLLPVLYERRWFLVDEPTLQDAYRKFTRTVFGVTEDRRTGLVTVSVEWKDPDLAAKWVDGLLADANAALQKRAIEESEANLRYLQGQASKTTILQVRAALYALMETQYKKLMIARNNEDYVFRVIDPAAVPKRKIRPRRTLMVLAAFVLGGLAGVGYVLVENIVRARRASTDGA